MFNDQQKNKHPEGECLSDLYGKDSANWLLGTSY
ncbi:hypothetical protein QE357_000732 [Siphonobacter sp. BAB-5404]|nr:hypothetical protein [Siphonobacter sp. SORGH_AS_0500]